MGEAAQDGHDPPPPLTTSNQDVPLHPLPRNDDLGLGVALQPVLGLATLSNNLREEG